MKMSKANQREYESLPTMEAKAKWILGKGIVAKLTVHPLKLTLVYQAFAADASLPMYGATEARAIANAKTWLNKFIAEAA